MAGLPDTAAQEDTMQVIDLRSDTVTLPSPEMRRAISEAELGDDGWGEDPTVNKLEAVAAERLDKEAGLLVASGTMGNLVSVLAHCQRGDEMIVGDQAHIFTSEVGHYAALGSISIQTIPNDDRGMIDPQAVEQAIRPSALTAPRTALVCLENTHNRASGTALTPRDMAAVAQVAHARGLPVHLDGARIFNAAVALGLPVAELVQEADSVTFCLSKSLACPVGSVVCGGKEFIARARKYRKMVGGGMRQAGIIAATGLVALEGMVARLAEDHENARRLARGLALIPGLSLITEDIQTNIVIVEVHDRPAHEYLKALAERGVRAAPNVGQRIRFVTHYGTNAEDIDAALEVIEAVARERSRVA